MGTCTDMIALVERKRKNSKKKTVNGKEEETGGSQEPPVSSSLPLTGISVYSRRGLCGR